ncbi:MAG: hypothetical protein LBK08_05860 [Treponema sp.]|nr:hypothetical protein [Treponema sp.]
MAKTIPFPANKAAPLPGKRPATKTPEEPPENGAVMAALRERRDRAIAWRLAVQNNIVKGTLIPRENMQRISGRIRAAWQSVIVESSYSTVPSILAFLEEKDPSADARLRFLLDGEAYRSGGNTNKAMQKWLRLREAREETTNAGNR